jgi:hypothetical protein
VSTISPLLLSDLDRAVKYLPLSYVDLTEPSPAAATDSTRARDGGESPGFVAELDLDQRSPVELWSRDSSFVDSSPCDDSIFSQSMRYPSPDPESTSTDATQYIVLVYGLIILVLLVHLLA